jgi:hypothetical protein
LSRHDPALLDARGSRTDRYEKRLAKRIADEELRLFFAMTMMAIADTLSAQAQTTTPGAQTPFQFELVQAFGPHGRRPLILREGGRQ